MRTCAKLIITHNEQSNLQDTRGFVAVVHKLLLGGLGL